MDRTKKDLPHLVKWLPEVIIIIFFFEKLIFLLKIQKELKIYYFGNQSTKIKQRHLGFRIYELKIQVLGKAIHYFNVSLMIESNTSQSWVMEFLEARYVAYKRGDN